MPTPIAPSRPTRNSARTVSASACREPAHLRKALLAEAKKRSEQLEQPAPPLDDDVGQALWAAAERTLAEVDEALHRWTVGSYGLCLRCDTEIPVARLELRPWAPLCIDCSGR